jgi:chromosome segregation ATPase
VDEVTSAKMLSPGVSPEEKQQMHEQFNAAIRDVEALDPEVHEASAAVDKANVDGQDANSRLKDASKAISELQENKARVKQSEKKLKEAEHELAKGDDGDKKRLVAALKTHISKYISSLENSSLHCDEWMRSSLSLVGVKLSEEAMLEKKDKIK